ncbi:XkdX family protein [Lactiplantibacillus plantarum]|nr:XkdX family protein [Lactiplantibacillus plantarum]MBS0936332.1 XkdX family protein [Lactiplantibacillus plantarum]MBS0943629.1 XkdX family protein [Lactiplantibacillus plantarum]
MFEFIKMYYEMGLYTKDNLATFKAAAMITATEYDQLVSTVAA